MPLAVKPTKTASHPRISYSQAKGTGAGTLFIMGFTMRGLVWRPVLEHLSRAIRPTIFDNRGIGLSETNWQAWTMADLADDAARVIDELGEPQHVVGVSLGGMIAQELVLRHTPKVKSLTLIATQPGGPTAFVPPAAGLGSVLRIAKASTAEAKRKARCELLYTGDFLKRADPKLLAQRFRDVEECVAPQSTARRQLAAVRGHDTRRRLSLIGVPTLVIEPTEDRLCDPRHSQTLAAGIPGAEHVRFQGAGHGLIVQYAERLASEIERFVLGS